MMMMNPITFTLGKGMNPLISPSYLLNCTKMALAINNPQIFICYCTKNKPKAIIVANSI